MKHVDGAHDLFLERLQKWKNARRSKSAPIYELGAAISAFDFAESDDVRNFKNPLEPLIFGRPGQDNAMSCDENPDKTHATFLKTKKHSNSMTFSTNTSERRGIDKIITAFIEATFGCSPAGTYEYTHSQLAAEFAKRQVNTPFRLVAPVRIVESATLPPGHRYTNHVDRIVVATEDIKAGRFLGMMDGDIHFLNSLRDGLDLKTQYLAEKYVFTIKHLEKTERVKDGISETDYLVIQLNNSPEAHYQWVAELNDVMALEPDEPVPLTRDEMKYREECNVIRVEIIIMGWPFVFIVAIRDISESEELVLNYADDWKEQRMLYPDYEIYNQLVNPLSQIDYDKLITGAIIKTPFAIPEGPANAFDPSHVQTDLNQSLEVLPSLIREMDETSTNVASVALACGLVLAVQPSMHHELKVTQGNTWDRVKLVSLKDLEEEFRDTESCDEMVIHELTRDSCISGDQILLLHEGQEKSK
ncbi:hypothetical protein HDU77_008122 [Chytriomyces hyalinus]|nr:hypothetical protein HDU77_008122 [Chytriomyces hyalinus]